MKSVKKNFYAIIIIAILSVCLVNNFVYADEITTPIKTVRYSLSYYIATIVVIAIVVGISIFILRKIYKSNQLEKDEENVKGEKR